MTIRSIDKEGTHKASFKNREIIERSSLCGCFHCFAIVPPSLITSWADEGQTAKCPVCDIDSVIGDAGGSSVSKAFLAAMHDRYFGEDDETYAVVPYVEDNDNLKP